MTTREWPVHRAQAKCARIAADFLKDDAHPNEARALLQAAISGGAEYDGTAYVIVTESAFREMLGDVLSWGHEEIDPAVEWVYGETAYEKLSAAVGETPRGEKFTGGATVGICIPCERPTNVFLSPGGVEPDEWRTR